jgi:SAM-dependent methyltransferase
MKLNLGSGKNILQGYVNLDKCDIYGVDCTWDLNELPLPFDEIFTEIKAYHILEHLNNVNEVIGECYRILKPNGILYIQVPYGVNYIAIRDPTHINFFNLLSFDYFCMNHEYNYYFSFAFRDIKRKIVFDKKFLFNYIFEKLININKTTQLIYETSCLQYLLPALYLNIQLTK